jgi:uncharacterized membrane protein
MNILMRRNLFLFIVLFASCSSFLTACYYDKADIIYPSTGGVVGNCDTANITYANQVVQVLNTHCNTCHSSAAAASIGGGINLSTYTSVKTYATSGSLLNSILQNGKASPMPKNASKLDNCSITKIQTWINKGALNN